MFPILGWFKLYCCSKQGTAIISSWAAASWVPSKLSAKIKSLQFEFQKLS